MNIFMLKPATYDINRQRLFGTRATQAGLPVSPSTREQGRGPVFLDFKHVAATSSSGEAGREGCMYASQDCTPSAPKCGGRARGMPRREKDDECPRPTELAFRLYLQNNGV